MIGGFSICLRGKTQTDRHADRQKNTTCCAQRSWRTSKLSNVDVTHFLCDNSVSGKTLVTCETSLHSHLRPTTRECVHLLTRGHFRSRNRWRSQHLTRSIRKPKEMLHANLMAPVFYRTGVMADHCGNRDFFDLFAPVTLTQLSLYTNLTRIT